MTAPDSEPAPSDTPAGSEAVRRFQAAYPFPFDPFQVQACDALLEGSSVLVAAPTGSGKTVVGEFAAWLALQQSGKTFYTTPIKALSNQKYSDFVTAHGAENVGLLTGDNSLNGDASIVVMTTEVLRNMIYEESEALERLRYVVLDEVHYLQNRYRGAVWEEILIHLPVDVQIVSLSATVSNAEEFAEWLQTLRGRTEVMIEERRPVELRLWYLAGDELLPMFVQTPSGEPVPNPRGRDFDRRDRRSSRPGRGGRRPATRQARIPLRTDVVDRLYGEKMLPAIYFIFSRKGCSEAVRQCLREHLVLTDPEERDAIRRFAEQRTAELSPLDLGILGYDEWLAGLERGIASHHAGMIPPFKEVVEELFAGGLVKVVFATETLALGINMPARTVVIENLTKFTGEKHELMTPGEFTQLSGRAGRRGKDELGHAVVLLQRFTPFDAITRLASARTYPLRSSFQPSYNMAVNLVRNYERVEAEHLVNSSFAQFQTDRGVVHLERTREQQQAYLASYREKMQCDQGDIDEYMDLLQTSQRLEGRKGTRERSKAIGDALARLKPGDVVDVLAGRKRGRYVIVATSERKGERRPRMLVVSERGSMSRVGPGDLEEEPVKIGRVELPERHELSTTEARRDLGRRLADFETAADSAAPAADDELKVVRRALTGHPVHRCPDLGRHLHFAERARRLEKELRGIERRISRQSATLARRFDQVLSVLEQMGYVRDWQLTSKGETLTSIYSETDLLVVELLEQGWLAELDPPELAAMLSTLVYETRGPEGPPSADLPTPATKQVWRRVMRAWRRIKTEEEARRLDLTREPDPGFVQQAYAWAAGYDLDDVLGPDDAPGDFVRAVKQLIDLLRQVESVVPPGPLADNLAEAGHGLDRGIVAYSSLEL